MRHLLLSLAVITLASLSVGCDQLSDAIGDSKSTLDVTIETDYTFKTALDVAAATGEAAGTKTPTELAKDMSLPAQDVDLVKEAPALKDAKGRVKSLEITQIQATPSANSVTGTLPSFDIYIGALGEKDVSKAFKIATIPPIPSKSTAVVNATIHAQGTKNAQQHLTTLASSQFMVAKLVVAKGGEVPGGKTDLSIKMALKAVLSPVK